MSEKNPVGPEIISLPFVFGKAALDMTMMTTLSLARVAQIVLQSADTALAKYIELTEQEIGNKRRETVKVE
jgi:hypothetical protein